MKCREGAGRGGGEKRRISRRPNYIISPQIQIDGRKKKGQKEVKYPSAIFHLVQSRRAAIHSIPLHTNPAGSVPRLPPALYMVLLCASDFSAALANVAVANVPGRLNFFCCWGRVCGGGGSQKRINSAKDEALGGARRESFSLGETFHSGVDLVAR